VGELIPQINSCDNMFVNNLVAQYSKKSLLGDIFKNYVVILLFDAFFCYTATDFFLWGGAGRGRGAATLGTMLICTQCCCHNNGLISGLSAPMCRAYLILVSVPHAVAISAAAAHQSA
jgi:hypothetical protein